MHYDKYIQSVYHEAPIDKPESIRLMLQNEIQGYIVGALAKGLGDAGIVFTEMTAARHCYGLPRYDTSNAIRFKVKEEVNDQIAQKIVEAAKIIIQKTLNVDVDVYYLKPAKKRNILGNFYVPKWEAIITIKKYQYKLILDAHPIIDERECRYIDELGIGVVSNKINAESVDAMLIETLALHFDEYSVSANTLFDIAWLNSVDAYIDLEVFEQTMWDRAVTDPERSLVNMQNLLKSSSVRRQFGDVAIIGTPDIMNGPTFNIAIDKMQMASLTIISELTHHFGEQYQIKISKAGAQTEYGMKVYAQGVDVTKAGLKAANTLNRKN